MWDHFGMKRSNKALAKSWVSNLCTTDECRARQEEHAKQNKFHRETIRAIIMDNLQYQINKRITSNIKMDEIIQGLSTSESEMYKEILKDVIKRTELIVATRDITAKKKIANGEEVRLINPKGDSLEKRIIKEFELVSKALVLDYSNRASEKQEVSPKTEDDSIEK